MTLLPMKPIKCLTTIMSLGIYRVSNTPFRLVWSFTPVHLIHLGVYVHTPAPWGLDLSSFCSFKCCRLLLAITQLHRQLAPGKQPKAVHGCCLFEGVPKWSSRIFECVQSVNRNSSRLSLLKVPWGDLWESLDSPTSILYATGRLSPVHMFNSLLCIL